MPLLKVKPPYASTTSDPDKTISDINKLLRKYGINNYQWTTLWEQGIVEPKEKIEIKEDMDPALKEALQENEKKVQEKRKKKGVPA